MKKKKKGLNTHQSNDIVTSINSKLVDSIDKEVKNLKNIVNLSDEEFTDLFMSKNNRDLNRKFKNTITMNSAINLRVMRDFSGREERTFDEIPQERMSEENETDRYPIILISEPNATLFTTES